MPAETDQQRLAREAQEAAAAAEESGNTDQAKTYEGIADWVQGT